MILDTTVSRDLQDRVDQSFVVSVVETVLGHCGVREQIEMGVRITTDAEIRRLNQGFRGVDAPTDVLSFHSQTDEQGDQTFSLPPDLPLQLGEVVVSYQRAAEQAKMYGHDLNRELGWLLVHGTLQLLGYSHGSAEQARAMRDQEEAILASLGLGIDLPGREQNA